MDLDTSKGFYLVVDTGKIAPELAGEIIVNAVKALIPPTISGVHTASQLQVDKTLAAVVFDVLHCEAPHV